MTRIDRYRIQWEKYRGLFGWSLPEWTPELKAYADDLIAGRQTPQRLWTYHAVPASVTGWVATRDPRYAVAARAAYEKAVLHDEKAVMAAASLTQAYRLQLWLGALGWVLDSTPFDHGFCDPLLDAVERLMNRLVQHLCPASMNWRLAEAAYLLRLSVVLDFLPHAQEWRGWAIRAINDAVHRQINPDGSHRERNPHYHIWMTRELAALWRIGHAMPELGLRIPAERVAAMWDYALFCNRPNGTENGLHDSRGWFVGGRPDAERKDRELFLREAGLPTALPPANGWFPDAGQALLRDSWDDDAIYVTFDATRWGESHCHYSRNSVQIHAYGRTLLADPGVFEYADTPLGNHGRSTQAHSTLNLNGWNQAQTNPSRTEYRHGDGYDLVVSDYEGTFHPGRLSMVHAGELGPGLWVSHHRCLLWVHGRAIVIMDSFVRVPNSNEQPETAPRLESNWQLGPGPVRWEESASRLVTQHADANLLMLFPTLPAGCTGTLHTGETDPPRGFVSDLYIELATDAPNTGHPTPAPQLSLSLAPMLKPRAEFVTVLVPFRGATPPVVSASAKVATLTEPGNLRLEWDGGRSDEFTWTYRLDMGLGLRAAFDTDASLVHIGREAKGGIKGVAMDATHIRPFRDDVAPQPGMLGIQG